MRRRRSVYLRRCPKRTVGIDLFVTDDETRRYRGTNRRRLKRSVGQNWRLKSTIQNLATIYLYRGTATTDDDTSTHARTHDDNSLRRTTGRRTVEMTTTDEISASASASATANANDAGNTPVKTPLTRTVGFSIAPSPSSGGHYADGAANGGASGSGVARELRAMRDAEMMATASASVRIPTTPSSASRGGEEDGFERAGEDVLESASRSPVMILPPNKARRSPMPVSGNNAQQQQVPKLAEEFTSKASVSAGEAPPLEEKEEGKSVKGGGPPRDIPPPKPKMTKAERRALQEAQRAAKAAKATESSGGSKKTNEGGGGANAQGDAGKSEAKKATGAAGVVASETTGGSGGGASATKKKNVSNKTAFETGKLKSGVSHLRSVRREFIPNVKSHPDVERLAVNYARGTTSGARERVYSLLRVLRTVVENFEVPSDSTYALAMTHHLNQVVATLDKARPMGVAMGNVVRSLKTHLARLTREEGAGSSNEECKQKTLMHIDYFIKEKLDTALESIVRNATPIVQDGDVIVTHGLSKVVSSILINAHDVGTKFTVVVVDSRPSSEGSAILNELCARGIDCMFTALNGLSYAMKHSTKVIIGAAACMSNGVVISRIGSSAVAHAAAECKLPVFVAAETYKFHERAQLDAFAYNEVGLESDIKRVPAGATSVLATSQELSPNLSIVNLTYDAIPPRCVKSIICESGKILPSDVPCYVLSH